jgi:hypothetical protein
MLPDGSMTAYPAPRALTKAELQAIVKDYADAAENAIEAGVGCRFPVTHNVHAGGEPLYLLAAYTHAVRLA